MKKITFSLLSKLIILIAIFSFTSCTIYKTGQTPDDIYYSPQQSNAYVVNSYYTGEDIRLRHQIYNYRFRLLDYDDWYYQNRYTNRNYIGFSYTYNCRYLNYNNWYLNRYWYNTYPYFSHHTVYPYHVSQQYNGRRFDNERRINTPRVFNLNTYRNNSVNSPIRTNGSTNNNRPVRTNNGNNRSAPIRVFH